MILQIFGTSNILNNNQRTDRLGLEIYNVKKENNNLTGNKNNHMNIFIFALPVQYTFLTSLQFSYCEQKVLSYD